MKPDTEFLDAPTPPRHGSTVLDPSEPASAPRHQHRPGRDATPAAPRVGKIFVIVLLAVAVAFVIGVLPRIKARGIVKKETRELALPTVEVATPEPSKAAAPLLFSGEVKALAEAAIYARANGYVRRWLVDIGAHVEKDQLLAELDTPEVERDLAQGRAELAQAQAARALAETTTKRWKEMLAAKTVSAQEADEKAADFTLKKATVEAGSAKVQRLEEMLGFAKITAPFAGTVTMRTLDVGQLVVPGTGRELFRIAQADTLRIFVRVPQNYARAMVVGETADVTFTELPGRTFEGKIVRTAGSIDPMSRTLLTELEVDNAKGELLAGSYAQVRFRDAKPEAVLTIPSNALLFRNDGTLVGVVGNDSRVSLRKVTLGRDFGQSVEVTAGLTSSDHVVVNPPDSLVEGSQVRVAKQSPPAQE